jgi:hypothetical protein
MNLLRLQSFLLRNVFSTLYFLQQIGIQLPQHEIEELLDFINEQKHAGSQQPAHQAGRRGSVNFK